MQSDVLSIGPLRHMRMNLPISDASEAYAGYCRMGPFCRPLSPKSYLKQNIGVMKNVVLSQLLCLYVADGISMDCLCTLLEVT